MKKQLLVVISLALLTILLLKLFSKVAYYSGSAVSAIVLSYTPSMVTTLYEGTDGYLHMNDGKGRIILRQYVEIFSVEEDTFGLFLFVFEKHFLLIMCSMAFLAIALNLEWILSKVIKK